MPALGTKISGSFVLPSGNAYAPDSAPHIAAFSDGRKIALFRTTIGSTFAIYNGSAWVAATGSSLITGNPLQYPHSIVQIGATVYLWYINTTNNNVQCIQLPWNTTTHAMGTQSTVCNSNAFASSFTATAVSAVWDATHSYWYLLVGSTSTTTYILSGSGPSGVPATIVPTFPGSSVMSVARGAVVLGQNGQSATTLHAVAASGNLRTITITGAGTITQGTNEVFATRVLASYLAVLYDSGGNLDLAYETGTSPVALCTVKRTGANAYSSITTLDSSVGTSQQPITTCYNSLSGDLWVYYTDTGTQSNGQVQLLRRISGIWGTPLVAAGGDSSGYGAPSAAATFDGSNSDFIYTFGTGSGSWAVYAVRQPTGTTPNTPAVSAPSGNTGATGSPPTPTLVTAYSNLTPGDTQGSAEWKVLRTSDSVVMWDSGQVSGTATSVSYGAISNTGDVNYIAPTSLAYGIQYSAQVRQWDSVLATVSSWSTAVTFTLFQAPTATITSITSPSGGTTSGASPVTLGGTTMDIAVSVSQAQSDTINAYQVTIWDSTGTTVIDQSALTTLSPAIASGSSVTIASYTAADIQNGATYLIGVAVQDATTLALGQSPTWTATVSFTPPAAVSTPSVQINPNAGGNITLRWTNPGGIASVTVLRRLTGTSTWTTLASGSLRTRLVDYNCPLNTLVDYGIQTVDSRGVGSPIVIIAGQTLGLVLGRYGYLLNDIAQPGTLWAAMGAINDWDSGTQRPSINDEVTFVPSGQQAPKSSFGPTNYWEHTSREYTHLATDTDGTTTISGAAMQQALLAMQGRMLQYRDPNGFTDYVIIKGVTPGQRSAIHLKTVMTIGARLYTGTPPVV